MSSVLVSPQLSPWLTPGKGGWAAAAVRFHSHGVGMISLVIVVLFLLLVFAAGLGLFAKDWQVERGVPDAPPTFVGPAAQTENTAIAAPSGPNVDISAIDPLAPRYKEWAEAAKKYQTTEAVKAPTLPFGGDPVRRDVLDQAVKGAQVSILVGVCAAAL